MDLNNAHKTELSVRYVETDRMGIVHHSKYIVYFELGRTQFMKDRGVDYAKLEDEGVYLALIETGCKHLASATYGDDLIIYTGLKDYSKVKITFEYQIYKKGSDLKVAEGFTILACVSKELKPKRIPDKVINALE